MAGNKSVSFSSYFNQLTDVMTAFFFFHKNTGRFDETLVGCELRKDAENSVKWKMFLAFENEKFKDMMNGKVKLGDVKSEDLFRSFEIKPAWLNRLSNQMNYIGVLEDFVYIPYIPLAPDE